jgi:alkylresorcinol/alkylpyrone synthase
VVTAAIIGIGTAVPRTVSHTELWHEFFRDHFGDDIDAARIWQRAGVRRRGAVVTPLEEDVQAWGTEARMQRFLREALPLSHTAVCGALSDAGLEPADVDNLTVVTCTGYGTPSLDSVLVDRLGMTAATQRLHIGHMGCYAALPGLAAVSDAATARHLTSVLLCVELASLHLQPRTTDVDQVVAHALFADAAAAVVVALDDPGLEVVDFASRTDSRHADQMRWDVTDHGFRMRLSAQVPDVLASQVRELVTRLLATHRLDVRDVARWVVHPGGPKIVEVVADRLGLTDELDVSREVLAEHGNCSSATVLLILERVFRTDPPAPGEHVVMMAFGPGLTLYAALLRRRG